MKRSLWYTEEPGPLFAPRRDRSWIGLAISAGLHLLLIALVVQRDMLPETLESEESATEQVDFIPLNPPPPPPGPVSQALVVPPIPETAVPEPPPPPPAPEPEQEPEPTPVPPDKQVALGPDSDHPDLPPRDGDRKPLTREPPVTDPDGERKPETEAPEPPKRSRRIETASEALRRLQGSMLLALAPPPASGTNGSEAANTLEGDDLESSMGAPRLGPSPFDARRWRPSNPTATGQCPEIPDLGQGEDGKPLLATVRGRILTNDRRGPLVGAHLQVVGTTFVTWTTGTGEYELQFDPKSLEKCRTQYVRVTAPGYKTELLVLSIGPRVRSDDVVMRKR